MFLLLEPPPTPFDLQFRVTGIPVRVHPLFWLGALIMGAGSLGNFDAHAGIDLAIWIGVLFVSILVHELGHAYTMIYFGERPRVLLHMMGGLAISDGGGAWGGRRQRRSAFEQVAISAAGPGAGFLLAGLGVGVTFALGGTVVVFWLGDLVPIPIVGGLRNPYLLSLLNDLMWVNVFWGLMNLLPVYPLDGGQIAQALWVMADPWEGLRKSLWLSVFVGAAAAVAGMMLLNSIFIALLFGSMAFSCLQLLQQMSGRGGGMPW